MSVVHLMPSILLALQGAAAPAHVDAPSFLGSPEEEIASLASNLDAAIKVCSEESARAAAHRTEIGKVEKRAINAGMLTWISEPSQDLVEQARGRPARFGRWLDPHARIWMIAYDSYPSCRILVGGSPWTAQVRPILYSKITDDNFWKVDEAEKSLEGDMVRATFYADLPANQAVRPIISIVAPKTSVEGALQLSIGVHVVNKENQ